MICPQDRRRRETERSDGRPRRAHRREHDQGEEGADQEQRQRRAAEQEHEPLRSLRDAAAEEVGGAGPEDAAGRHGVPLVAPVPRPLDRMRPLVLHVRARGPVEERLLELAPAPLERDPGEGALRRGRVARDRLHDRLQLAMRPERVVAADSRVGGAAQVERGGELVGVRAGGRVDDGMRAVDDLELLVAPGGALGALVGAVPDLGRLLRERLARICGSEDELGHLPVALVGVVEVVERVEEPVLQRELPRIARIGRDVGVDGRLRAVGEAARPELVARNPRRAGHRGSRGGTRSGRRDRSPAGPISTRSVRFHGPRKATVGSPKSMSTSVGM